MAVVPWSPWRGAFFMTKTNTMRLLDAAGIYYSVREFPVDEADLSAIHAAEALGIPVEQVFKTLVLQGVSGLYFVCCIPGASELDLKKTARAVKEKSVNLIPMKDIQPLTGYIRGGCSPIGMKKHFPTFIDETAQLFDEISVSAGERGLQLIIAPQDLAGFIHAQFADIS